MKEALKHPYFSDLLQEDVLKYKIWWLIIDNFIYDIYDNQYER
jgi:hypothetical protein